MKDWTFKFWRFTFSYFHDTEAYDFFARRFWTERMISIWFWRFRFQAEFGRMHSFLNEIDKSTIGVKN